MPAENAERVTVAEGESIVKHPPAERPAVESDPDAEEQSSGGA